MAKIGVPGLPAKTGTILDAGYLHLNESSVDKKVTITQLLAKIEDQYSVDIVTFLGSANKAEGRANLSIDRRIAVDNTDYAILATDKVVAQTGIMSATRTFSLPTASTVQAGAEIIVIDESGTVTPTNKIIIQRNGTDTIDGLTQKEILIPYGNLRLLCNGVSGWKVADSNKSTSLSLGVSYLSKPIEIKNNATDANNDIDFSDGNFVFHDYLGQASFSALTKQLDAAWSVGNNVGGLFSGTKAANSTYHCFTIFNPITGASDAGFLLGVAGTAPDPTSVLPSGYTKFSYRGSILTNSSGNIIGFVKNANYFMLKSPVLSLSAATSGYTTAKSETMSTPLGVKTLLIPSVGIVNNPLADNYVYLSSLEQNDDTPSRVTGVLTVGHAKSNITDAIQGSVGYLLPLTNNSSQIRVRSDNSNGTIVIATLGWIDNNIIY